MALGAGLIALLILAATPSWVWKSTLTMVVTMFVLTFIGYWVMIGSGILEGILH